MRTLIVAPAIKGELEQNMLWPMGITHIGAAARAAGHNVKLLDLNVSKESEIEEILKTFKPELVGISANTSQIKEAFRIAQKVKQNNSDTITVIGGCHATNKPKQTLKNKFTDVVVIGEGDLTFPELISAFEKKHPLNDVKGIAYKINKQIHVTDKRPLVKDLDMLPMQAFDLLDLEKYTLYGKGACMVASRGCPYNCIYCGSHTVFGKKIRRRSPKLAVDELEAIVNAGCEYVLFFDDTFTADKEYVKDLCDEIVLRGLNKKVEMWVNTRVDCVDLETLKLMRHAGFTDICFGIESAVQNTLNYMKKGTLTQQAKTAVELSKKAGFDKIGAFFIVNFPCESREDMQETLKLATSLPLYYFRISALTPYPGTEIYEMCEKEGLTTKKTLESYEKFGYLNNVIINNPNVSPKEVAEMISNANRSMLFNPRWVLQRLKYALQHGRLQSIRRGAFYFFNLFKGIGK